MIRLFTSNKAIFYKFYSIFIANLKKSSDLLSRVTFYHNSYAFLAAFTARSISSFYPADISAIFSDVQGFITGIFLPDKLSTNSLIHRLFYIFMFYHF